MCANGLVPGGPELVSLTLRSPSTVALGLMKVFRKLLIVSASKNNVFRTQCKVVNNFHSRGCLQKADVSRSDEVLLIRRNAIDKTVETSAFCKQLRR